jgi:hypothetical protein
VRAPSTPLQLLADEFMVFSAATVVFIRSMDQNVIRPSLRDLYLRYWLNI